MQKNPLPLNNPHHLQIVERFYALHPEIPFPPSAVYQHDSWSDVPSRALPATALVFVDGGILHDPLDVGEASLVNDGGIIEAPIRCGYFYRGGGITRAQITESHPWKETIEGTVVKQVPKPNSTTFR